MKNRVVEIKNGECRHFVNMNNVLIATVFDQDCVVEVQPNDGEPAFLFFESEKEYNEAVKEFEEYDTMDIGNPNEIIEDFDRDTEMVEEEEDPEMVKQAYSDEDDENVPARRY